MGRLSTTRTIASAGVLVAAGYVASTSPAILLYAGAAFAFVVVVLGLRRAVAPAWAGFVGASLAGYAFLGKIWSYLSLGPVYVGEIALAFGVLALIVQGSISRALKGKVIWAIVVLAMWGMARTLPYIEIYGIDALRDAVLWAYAGFAVVIYSLDLTTRQLRTVLAWYRRAAKLMLIWVPIFYLTTKVGGQTFLTSNATLLPKAGDLAVHLAGIASLIGLGLDSDDDARQESLPTWVMKWGWWGLWGLGALLVSVESRAAMVAIVVSCVFTIVVSPSVEWTKPAIVGATMLVLLLVVNPTVEVRTGRTLSVTQVLTNLQSSVSSSDSNDLDGTKEWRVRWWRQVWDYTVNGDYRWLGKGFGVNLAADDGLQAWADAGLRSPHNVYVTWLARGGVIGLAAWCLVQFAILAKMMLAYVNSRSESAVDTKLVVWLTSYWIAAQVNSLFDVYLEGPQGGIWFWCIVGVSLVVADRALRTSRRGAVRPVAPEVLIQPVNG
jgi:hypothetical protein